MSDTLYDVTSGFYDSLDQDRLYSADQMNMPYKRLISEGVFATPAGTASTDFQVVAVSGMGIKVCAGNALLGDKWVEMTTDQPITVSNNAAGNPRIDSIILRVNRNSAARKASIIYRPGTAASSPTAPALVTTSGIYELRLADIRVASGATSIGQSVITDQRGTADCPWITSLIKQVDTSTLFAQYQAAQEEQLDDCQEAWEDYLDGLTRADPLELDMRTGSWQTPSAGSTSYITMHDLGITDYDPTADIVMLFINGLYAIENDKWHFVTQTDPTDPKIVFSTPLNGQHGPKQSVYAVIFKPATTTDVGSPITNAQIDALFS